MELKSKQEKFCLAFAKTGNARQSYLDAGYKCKPETADANASRLLKNAMVQKRLAELHEKVVDEEIADIKEMQKILTNIIRKNTDDEVVLTVGIGDGMSSVEKVKKEPSVKDIINAINTLGKMQGAFIDRMDIMGSVPVVISGGDDLAD